MKTKQEIDTEIAALTACKSYVPANTMFGEDNHALIDAQITTLANGWDEDEARGHFEDLGELDRMIDGACAAAEWRADLSGGARLGGEAAPVRVQAPAGPAYVAAPETARPKPAPSLPVATSQAVTLSNWDFGDFYPCERATAPGWPFLPRPFLAVARVTVRKAVVWEYG